MRTKTLILTFTLTLAAAFTGCGEDDAPDGTGDARRLNQLGPDEQKALCDWTAMEWGGYGKEHECSDGSFVSGPETPEDCFDAPTGCTATVAQAKTCIKAMVRDKCEGFDLPPECAPLRTSACGLP